MIAICESSQSLRVGYTTSGDRLAIKMGGTLKDLMDFLNFRTMLTPKLIQMFFIGSAGLSALLGLIMFSQGNEVGGLILAIGAPLFIRIWCEVVILFFRIHDTLRDVLAELKNL